MRCFAQATAWFSVPADIASEVADREYAAGSKREGCLCSATRPPVPGALPVLGGEGAPLGRQARGLPPRVGHRRAAPVSGALRTLASLGEAFAAAPLG